jgi:Sensors of blue-light using FAD
MSAFHHPQSDEPMSGHVFPLLYNLVYCSRAVAGVDDAEVDRIIESSRRNNPAQGITGLLVFGSGIFFQWLEGPRDNVTQLMTILKSDTRHESVVQLSATEEVRERLFPDWDMELVTGADIRDVLQDALDTAKEAKNAEALGLLLAQLDSDSGPLGDLGAP